MPNTISSSDIKSFQPNTKIKSAEVNQNFSNMRGDLIPLDPTISSSPDNTYDLGISSHQWRDAHIGRNLIINGTTYSSAQVGGGTNWIADKFPSVALTATSNNSWSSTSDNNPLGLYFDDIKCRIGVDRRIFKGFARVKGDSEPDTDFGYRFIPIDQYGNYLKNVNFYSHTLKQFSEQFGMGFYFNNSYTAYLYISEIFTNINLLQTRHSYDYLATLTTSLDNSTTSNILDQRGPTFLASMGASSNHLAPLVPSVSTNNIHTFKALKNIYSDYFVFSGLDFIYNAGTTGSGAGVYAGGTFYPSGEKLSLSTAEIEYTPASYSGSKGGRVARYLYKDTNETITSAITITSILEGSTLAVSGQVNTNTMSIGQNDGNYNNGTIIRVTGDTSGAEMLNCIVSGGDNSGTSWTMKDTNSSAYTTTNSFIEHYANAYPAATHGSETLAGEYLFHKDWGIGTGVDYKRQYYGNSTDYTNTVVYLSQNGSRYAGSNYTRVLEDHISIRNTNAAGLITGNYCSGIDLQIYQPYTSSSANFRCRIDGIYIESITLPNTIGMINLKMLSDAPAGEHTVLIENTSTAGETKLTGIRYYVPKRPACSKTNNIIQQEYMLNADYRPAPQDLTDKRGTNQWMCVDQGVVSQSLSKYSAFDPDTTWTYSNARTYYKGYRVYSASTTAFARVGIWGTGLILRYRDSNNFSSKVDLEYSYTGQNTSTAWSGITTTAFSLSTGYSSTNPFTNGSSSIDQDVEATTYAGKFVRLYNMPLNYYYFRFYNQTNQTMELQGIDYITPIYDFKSHYEHDVGGRSAYNEIQYSPLPEKKTYDNAIDESDASYRIDTGWFAVSGANSAPSFSYTISMADLYTSIYNSGDFITIRGTKNPEDFNCNLYFSIDNSWSQTIPSNRRYPVRNVVTNYYVPTSYFRSGAYLNKYQSGNDVFIEAYHDDTNAGVDPHILTSSGYFNMIVDWEKKTGV